MSLFKKKLKEQVNDSVGQAESNPDSDPVDKTDTKLKCRVMERQTVRSGCIYYCVDEFNGYSWNGSSADAGNTPDEAMRNYIIYKDKQRKAKAPSIVKEFEYYL